MRRNVTIQEIQNDFEALLARMAPGETLTVIGEDSTPQALVVRIQPASPPVSDAWAELEALGAELSANWPDGKSAAEAIAEIRR